MSKSDVSKYSRILLTDTVDEINIKINKAKSDSLAMPNNVDELKERLEINNLLTIYSCISGKSIDVCVNTFASKDISFFKKELRDIVINLIEPISKEIQKIKNDREYIKSILEDGSQRARERATLTISNINTIMGFKIE